MARRLGGFGTVDEQIFQHKLRPAKYAKYAKRRRANGRRAGTRNR
jgi:hypothetical protein